MTTEKEDLHDQAMSRIDGYLEAKRDAAIGARWLSELQSSLGPSVVDYASPVQSQLADAAAGDGKFPEGVGLRHFAAVQAANARNEEIRQVQIFRETALARAREAIQNGSAPALEYLNDTLAAFVDDLLEVAPALRALPDLETIAETNDTEALALRKRRGELVETYLQIRGTQTRITKTVVDSLSDSTLRHRGRKALLQVGQVREAIDAEKALLGRRLDAYRDADQRGATTGRQELVSWWQANPDPLISADDWGAPLPGRDVDTQMDALLRIVENTTPWVPTVDQLLAAQELSEVATGLLYRQGDDERIAQALDKLQEVTGYLSDTAPVPTGAEPKPRGRVRLSPAAQRRLLQERLSR